MSPESCRPPGRESHAVRRRFRWSPPGQTAALRVLPLMRLSGCRFCDSCFRLLRLRDFHSIFLSFIFLSSILLIFLSSLLLRFCLPSFCSRSRIRILLRRIRFRCFCPGRQRILCRASLPKRRYLIPHCREEIFHPSPSVLFSVIKKKRHHHIHG